MTDTTPEDGTSMTANEADDALLETVEKINGSLSNLWRKHMGLAGDVEQLLDLMELHIPSGPLHWETLSDVHEASLLERVADFVDFLQRVYLVPGSDFKIKQCWWQHSDVLWQLTAMYAAFIDSYNPKEPPSGKQAAFHEHVLWPILHRIKSLQSQKECNATEHVPVSATKAQRDPALIERLEQLRGSDGNEASHTASDPAGDDAERVHHRLEADPDDDADGVDRRSDDDANNVDGDPLSDSLRDA